MKRLDSSDLRVGGCSDGRGSWGWQVWEKRLLSFRKFRSSEDRGLAVVFTENSWPTFHLRWCREACPAPLEASWSSNLPRSGLHSSAGGRQGALLIPHPLLQPAQRPDADVRRPSPSGPLTDSVLRTSWWLHTESCADLELCPRSASALLCGLRTIKPLWASAPGLSEVPGTQLCEKRLFTVFLGPLLWGMDPRRDGSLWADAGLREQRAGSQEA